MARQAFLINPRRRKAVRKTSRRKSPSRKSVPQWVKSKGFASWGAYMASIRPGRTTKGAQVAKRRRRRKAVARPAARRRRRTVHRNSPVYAANPRRRRRRHSSYRRNPPISMNPKGILKTVTNAGVNAVGVLTGKVTARVGRGKLGMVVGTPVGMLTEIAIGVAGGIALKKVSARFAEMFITGAMVSVLEPLAKGFLPATVGGALGDEDGLISGDSLSGYLNGGGGVGAYDQGVGTYDLQEA